MAMSHHAHAGGPLDAPDSAAGTGEAVGAAEVADVADVARCADVVGCDGAGCDGVATLAGAVTVLVVVVVAGGTGCDDGVATEVVAADGRAVVEVGRAGTVVAAGGFGVDVVSTLDAVVRVREGSAVDGAGDRVGAAEIDLVGVGNCGWLPPHAVTTLLTAATTSSVVAGPLLAAMGIRPGWITAGNSARRVSRRCRGRAAPTPRSRAHTRR
jgi:hypothetical protein